MNEKDINHIKPIIGVMSNFLSDQLKKTFTPDEIKLMIDTTHKTFEANIEQIPEVGSENPWLTSITGVVWLCGLWLQLEKRGLQIPEISEITQAALKNFTKSNIPQEKLQQIRDIQCSEEFVDNIAQRSQKCTYKDDWIVEKVLPQKGDNFKIGYNVYQCPIVTYLKQQKLERFAPYFCLNDYPMFEATGILLERSCTLAEGAKYCDFRFKYM